MYELEVNDIVKARLVAAALRERGIFDDALAIERLVNRVRHLQRLVNDPAFRNTSTYSTIRRT